MHYSSSSLVLTAVQQERQIQKWSNELAVYCLGLNQGVNKKQVSGHLAWKKDEMLDTCFYSIQPSSCLLKHYYLMNVNKAKYA